MATRIFARFEAGLASRYGAVAVVLFRNADAGTVRMRSACSAYVRVLPGSGDVEPEVPLREQMATVWPTSEPSHGLNASASGHDQDAVAHTCPRAVASYDFDRAAIMRAQLARRDRAVGMGRGPWIVAWAPGARHAQPNAAFVVFDMSRFDDNDLDAAFEKWSSDVQGNPDIYRTRWNREALAQVTVRWLNTFGAKAIGALKIVRESQA